MTDTIPQPKGKLEAALGGRFRSVREGRGIHLTDLVKSLGVSINTIRWHEKGARMMRVDTLYRAAEAIGCEPLDLININGDEDDGIHEDARPRNQGGRVRGKRRKKGQV